VHVRLKLLSAVPARLPGPRCRGAWTECASR